MAKHHKKAHKPVQEESKKVKILRILSAVSIFLPCITYLLLILWIFPARIGTHCCILPWIVLVCSNTLRRSRCLWIPDLLCRIHFAIFRRAGDHSDGLDLFASICSKVLSKDQRTSCSSLLPVAWASAFMRTCLLVLPYECKSGSAHSGI